MAYQWTSTTQKKKPAKKLTATKANSPVVGEQSANTSTEKSTVNLTTQVKNQVIHLKLQ